MSEASNPIEVACPKCRHQIYPGLTGQQIEIDMRCPNCGYLMGSESATYKKLLQARVHEDTKGGGQSGDH